MPTHSLRASGRAAGLIYLVVVITGIISLAYVPSQTIVPGDAAATLSRIIAHEALFRLGIAASFACYLAFLVLPLALHDLLGSTHRRTAALMVVFAVVSVPISLLAQGPKLEVLRLIASASGVATPELATAVTASLAQSSAMILIAKLFWGLWLLPLGLLIERTRRLPRVLGWLLIAGCVGYLVDVFATVLLPDYTTSALRGWVTRPAALGEIGTCLWLVAMGAAPERARVR